MNSDLDVAVIGAGAAGLAATRRLCAAHVSVAAFEARARVGGRAHTVHEKYRLDLGCGWLHSANRNKWCEIGETHGFTIDRTPPPWERQSGDQDFPEAEQESFGRALHAFEQAIAAAENTSGDAPASSYLPPDGQWHGLIEAVGGFMSGARLKDVSAKDYARYEDTEINWRVSEGYGALIGAYGAGLPVRMRTPVKRIDHSGNRIVVETENGVAHARTVIIALPTPALASEAVSFFPALPEKIEAAASLPLGHAEKMFFGLAEPEEFPVNGHLFGALSAQTGSYHLRPFGRPLIEGFFAGAAAEAIKDLPMPDRFAQAEDELARLIGSSIRKRLAPLDQSDWSNDPFSRGAYSFAIPGCADRRAILAAPLERLFFAGEACSSTFFTTAHGAYETGICAAEQALAAL